MESPNKCPKCGGKNVWTFAGGIRQEEYCRDCNWLCDCGKRYPKTADQPCPSCETPRPVKSDVQRVGEWIERIRASGGSTTLVENLGRIGPAGRAAVPLLCELYRKHGKDDFLGCAAYDALRDLDALRDVFPDTASASGGGWAQPIPISAPKTPEEKLKTVSTRLLTIGWIEGVLAAFMLFVGILMAAFPNERQANDPSAPHPAIIPVVCAVGVIRAYFVVRGAMRMRARESYGNAILTALLTAIPVGGCCLLGFPFGIGALVVLCDPEVKRLFSPDSQEILDVLPAFQIADQLTARASDEPPPDGLYISREELPPGKSRCPRCSTLHDSASSRVKMPKATGAKAALEEFLSEIGNEQVRLKCPKCGTTYETQTTAPPKHTPPTSQSATAPATGMPVRDVAGVPPMSKKTRSLLKRLETPTTTRDALQLFERDFLPLGPEALEAIPHLFNKLSTLPGMAGGNGLIDLCYDGFVKIPGSFGEQGHSVAVTSMVQEVLRGSPMVFTHLGWIVRAVCGSVKRGAKGEGVLRALEEFKSWLASLSVDSQFKAGSAEDRMVKGMQQEWKTTLAQAIQDIKATSAPAVSPLPASGQGKTSVSAPEKGDEETAALIAKMEARLKEQPTPKKVQDPPPVGNRSAQMDAPARGTAAAAGPSKGLDPRGKLSIVCECGHRGTVKAEYSGRTVKCPRCQRKIQVPGLAFKSTEESAFESLDHDLAKTTILRLVGVVTRRQSDQWAMKRALQTLVSFAPREVVPLLISTLHVNQINAEELQIYSACTLGDIRDPRAVDALMDACDYDDICIRFAAAKALAQIAGLKGADALPTPPNSWGAEMKPHEPEFYRLLNEASDFFRPSYRKADWASGQRFAADAQDLSPNQALLLAEACRGFDSRRVVVKLKDTPLNRQVKSAVEHIRHKRITDGDSDWVCTVRDLPAYNAEYLADLDARIKWGTEPVAEDRKQRILLATAEDQLLTGLREMRFFKKVGDKVLLAGFLLYPHLRDCTIVLESPKASPP